MLEISTEKNRPLERSAEGQVNCSGMHYFSDSGGSIEIPDISSIVTPTYSNKRSVQLSPMHNSSCLRGSKENFRFPSIQNIEKICRGHIIIPAKLNKVDLQFNQYLFNQEFLEPWSGPDTPRGKIWGKNENKVSKTTNNSPVNRGELSNKFNVNSKSGRGVKILKSKPIILEFKDNKLGRGYDMKRDIGERKMKELIKLSKRGKVRLKEDIINENILSEDKQVGEGSVMKKIVLRPNSLVIKDRLPTWEENRLINQKYKIGLESKTLGVSRHNHRSSGDVALTSFLTYTSQVFGENMNMNMNSTPRRGGGISPKDYSQIRSKYPEIHKHTLLLPSNSHKPQGEGEKEVISPRNLYRGGPRRAKISGRQPNASTLLKNNIVADLIGMQINELDNVIDQISLNKVIRKNHRDTLRVTKPPGNPLKKYRLRRVAGGKLAPVRNTQKVGIDGLTSL